MNKQMELISIWKTSQHNKDLNLNVILYKVHKHWSPKEYILFSSGIQVIIYNNNTNYKVV